MKRSIRLVGLVCTAITGLVSIPLAAAVLDEAAEPSRGSLTFTLSAERPFAAPSSQTGRTEAFAEPELEKATGRTIPTFTRKILAEGRLYQFTMVGSDPFVRNARKVVVPVQIIPVRFDFDDGSVFDPTSPNLDCQGGGTPLGLALASPIFQNVDYGDGPRQFVEEIRRLEFWSQTGASGAINRGYSVRVSPAVLAAVHVKLTGFPTRTLLCGKVGYLDIRTWDNFVKGTLFPQIRKLGVTTQTFPLFLFSNVVLFDGDPSNCCILGYHSAFNAAGIQTYGVANYDSSAYFDGVADVSTLSHELAEWNDDPFINNATPPWGHVGQQNGCQANLEVGDPLSGSLHEVLMPSGFAYHPQELAFFSWFFNQVPSIGINGLYSSGGTFVTPAAPCQ
jgi:hypothetical protein